MKLALLKILKLNICLLDQINWWEFIKFYFQTSLVNDKILKRNERLPKFGPGFGSKYTFESYVQYTPHCFEAQFSEWQNHVSRNLDSVKWNFLFSTLHLTPRFLWYRLSSLVNIVLYRWSWRVWCWTRRRSVHQERRHFHLSYTNHHRIRI